MTMRSWVHASANPPDVSTQTAKLLPQLLARGLLRYATAVYATIVLSYCMVRLDVTEPTTYQHSSCRL
eukprot:1929531-Rhodomonas_salina.1